MPNNRLLGKTIVLTGTNKTAPVKKLIEDHGGECAVFPLIEAKELQSPEDEGWLAGLHRYDWLIFTSQNAVQAFIDKCRRAEMEIRRLDCKIASVGSRTTSLLEKHGLKVHFMPTTFSADVFVKEFPKVAERAEKKLFLRGNLAKPTIREGVANVTEWTIYETCPADSSIIPLTELLQQKEAIVVFASPSAVQVFHEKVAPVVGWQGVSAAAIGHITAAALRRLGVPVYVQPETYTMQAVIEEIILLEEEQ
ncbi:MAG: uroporphyrinogen-III synthase [Lysinibacillus sp.]